MSSLVFKKCTKCGKLKPVGNGSRLCFECSESEKAARVRKRDYKQEYQRRIETEDPKYKRFYKSKQWRMTSLGYSVGAKHKCEMDHGRNCKLTGGEKCEKCLGIGTDVHHIEPIKTPEGWKRRFDESNLELLCVCCHNCRHPEKKFHKKT